MSIFHVFLIYMIYSFLGWLVEVIDLFFIEGKFVNRGFMIGPYCPIYGKAVLLVITLLNDYISKPIGLFVMSIAICAIIEYMGSYILEKLFKTRWWDYTDRKFNINGRICLENLILFGFGCSLVMYVINPLVIKFISFIPYNVVVILAIIIFGLYLTDFIISFTIIWHFHNLSENTRKDSTESVTEFVKKEIKKKNQILYNRLVNSFPKLKILKVRGRKNKN